MISHDNLLTVKYIRISIDIHTSGYISDVLDTLGVYLTKTSRKIQFSKITLTDNVETFYEKIVTAFGNSAKIDSNK
jgi:hypothetical protein